MQEEISFGIWLRKQRRALDLTRQAFADQVGCAEVTLRRIEAGTLKPSNELASILLEKLGIPEPERPQWISFARGLSGFPPKFGLLSDKPITNLPAPLTTFIGREKEQADVIRLLSKHRLVTLVGSGGVGKTRLSIRVGEQALRNFADGVWLVELAPILDPLLVPRTTAMAIGLLDEPQRPVIDMLSDYLREKRMLVILDNCEHLLDSCAQLADTLLKRCPNLKILATSREALGILGEAVYQVPPLQLPDSQQVLDRFRDYESILLFEERAQLARVDFSLTLENASSVAKICTHLDGIPLGIELAAARVRAFSTEQIADRLQESFSLLSTGNRTALPRHQTLLATIDWSYNLLSPAEKSVFQRLSVFINGWTLDAAESICSDEKIASGDILYVLTNLTNKSLVVVEEKHVGTHYRMLQTIRQYADEKLIESGESDVLRNRHLEYFLNLAESAEPHLTRPEQLEWFAKLDADYGNLRLALECALNKDFDEPSLRLCGALGWFWSLRSYSLEASQWLRRALAKPSQLSKGEEMIRVKALYQDAALANNLDDVERMRNSAERSFALAQEVSDKRDIAIARFYLGLALGREGDYEHFILLTEQSITDFEDINDFYWQSIAYLWLSDVLIKAGRLSMEEGTYHCLELARKSGERSMLAEALLARGSYFYMKNQLNDARKYAEDADFLSKQIGAILIDPGFTFGKVAWLEGNYQEAKSIFMNMQARFDVLGDKFRKSIVDQELGVLASKEGDFSQAYIYLEEALATARGFDDQFWIVSRLAALGNTFYAEGKIEEFKLSYRESFFITKHKDVSMITKIYLLFSVLEPLLYQKLNDLTRILGCVSCTLETSLYVDPRLRRNYDLAEANAQQVLGDNKFEVAFAEGQNMSLDEALDLALNMMEEYRRK